MISISIYIIVASIIFYFGLKLHLFLKNKASNKPQYFEWLIWIGFVVWLMIFIISGMKILNEIGPDVNRVIAVAPVAISVVIFFFINRSKIKIEGFEKKN